MTAHQLPFVRSTGLAAAALLATGSLGLAQNPNTGPTTTLQELTTELFCTEVVDEGDESFSVSVKGTLGDPQTLKFNVCLVLDISTTMAALDAQQVGDANNDGVAGTRVDAAIFAAEALLNSLQLTPNVDFSVVAYAKDAAILDLGPAAGQQTWISNVDQDLDGNLIPDIRDVLRSLDTGALGTQNVGKFTPYDWDAGTDYTEALTLMNAAFALQPAGEINVGFFVSDGLPNQPPAFDAVGGPLDLAIAAGTTINTYGIGPAVATICDPGQPLDKIATGTGGTCNAVTDPNALVALLGGASATVITKVELCVNGNLVATQVGPDPMMLTLASTEIFPLLQLGNNVIEGKTTTADGTVVVASKNVDKTACLLLVGLWPAQLHLGSTDYIYVDHAAMFNVTEALTPTFTIPNIPSLIGMDLYMQVGMHNAHVFPTNAIQMSNGIKLTIGQGWSVYGSATGIWHWIDGSIQPGHSFKPRFDVLAM